MFDAEYPWPMANVGDVAEILDSRRIPLNAEERRNRSGPYPYWGANGIVDHIDDFLFDEPLVLMAEDGGYFADAATKPICHRLDGRVWVNNHAHVIRPMKVDRDFFYYWFVHRDITPFIKGGTRTKLNQADLKRLPIAIPPLEEQRRIVDVLLSLDDSIAATLAAFKQVCVVRSAHREKFVSAAAAGGTVRLSEIIVSMDSGWSPDCGSSAAADGEWAVLKTSAVTWDGYDDRQNKRLPRQLEPRPSIAVRSDDILITRAGPADRTGVVAIVAETEGHRMLSDKLIRVRVDEAKAAPVAIAEILGSDFVQEQFGRFKSGMAASQTNITQASLAATLVPFPGLDLQREFAASTSALVRSTKNLSDQLSRLALLKSAASRELLSGRLRVPA